MVFIGLDLAWSARNPSGAAVLIGDARGARLADVALLRGDGEVLAYVERHAGQGPAIVAIDAPLVVPNETGRRAAEDELSRVFRRYEAGAHPANRRLLARDGVVRGEALVSALAARGFIHAPAVEAGRPVRQVIEVYPHSAMVALFGLEKTLKYKARPGRTLEARCAAWRAYHAHLLSLGGADPALRGHESLLECDVSTLRPAALKRYEDQVDALFCAYIGVYAHRWGNTRCRTFGTLSEGYIYTPVSEAIGCRPDGSCVH